MKKDNHETTENKQKKGITSKQVVAMTGVILLVLLYAITLAGYFRFRQSALDVSICNHHRSHPNLALYVDVR